MGSADVFGVSNLDHDFKRVSDAAQELGRQERFLTLNKLFSKFAHPTAIVMNVVILPELDRGFREMFLANGVRSATATLRTIRDVVSKYFPLPAQAGTP